MNKNCPYCNEEMEMGYIQCRDGICWTEKKRLVAALPSLSKASVRLGMENGLFSGVIAEAYLCRACKKIVIDYAGK